MKVSVVNNRESKNINIPLAAVSGGAVGVVARQIFPVYRAEIDNYKFAYPDNYQKTNLITTKNSFVELVKKEYKNKPESKEALDLFVKRIQAKDAKEKNKIKPIIKKASATVQEEIKKMNHEFVKVMRASKEIAETNIKNLVKSKRPYAGFILPGVVVGASLAFVYNVVGKLNED